MFDVSALAVASTADCELNGPDGKPLFNPDTGERCSITMFGPASDECAEMRAHQQQRLMELLGKGDDRKEITATEDRKLTAEDLRKVTKCFNHFGIPGEFATPAEMFEAVYSNPALGWIRDQANAFFGKWGNFPAASKKK